MHLDIFSDTICPWCYVGKRRLEAALASPDMPASIAFTWRPFELNPDMPVEGVERKVYRARKFGEARSEGHWVAQRVHIVDQDGEAWEAMYTLEQQPGGSWEITGCSLLKTSTE